MADDTPAAPPGRLPHAAILAALEVRYDHLSARIVLDEALARADMHLQDHYSPEEASRLAWALVLVGPKPQPAVDRLLEFAGAAATHDAPEEDEEEEEEAPEIKLPDVFWN